MQQNTKLQPPREEVVPGSDPVMALITRAFRVSLGTIVAEPVPAALAALLSEDADPSQS
jgi:hypothetical protein